MWNFASIICLTSCLIVPIGTTMLNYACFDVSCNGEGCLYPAIKELGIDSVDVPTCTVTADQVCYVYGTFNKRRKFIEQQHQNRYILTCAPNEGLNNILPFEIYEENTDAGVVMTSGCGRDCTAPSTTTVPPTPTEIQATTRMMPKRRKRSTVPRRECCETNLCNHDSPCGSLTCSACSIFKDQMWILTLIGVFVVYQF